MAGPIKDAPGVPSLQRVMVRNRGRVERRLVWKLSAENQRAAFRARQAARRDAAAGGGGGGNRKTAKGSTAARSSGT